VNELHLFAGAGGGILGGILLGHTTVCAVEIEPYCREVLLQRQRDGILPKFPIWDDVRTFDGKPWRGKVDVVCGGFPCQDISVAGKRKGIGGERSGLWGEFARIIREIQPRYCFVENSPALVIRGLGTVLGDLATMGYDAIWGVLGAVDAGAPHKRDRIWIMANYMQNRDRLNGVQNIGRNIRNSEGWKKMGSIFDDCYKIKDNLQSWETESGHRGIVDGLAYQMDRLAAIGNGQVPAVAAMAWNILTASLEQYVRDREGK